MLLLAVKRFEPPHVVGTQILVVLVLAFKADCLMMLFCWYCILRVR